MTESTNIVRTSIDGIRVALRYFGPEDGVPITVAAQTPGLTDIVSALPAKVAPPGEVWTVEDIANHKIDIEFKKAENVPGGLTGIDLYKWYLKNGERTGRVWSVVESLPITDAIKTATNPELRDKHIANYQESLKNLGQFSSKNLEKDGFGEFGIKTVVGNLMVLNDWARNVILQHEDGSWALGYIHALQQAFDMFYIKRHAERDPKDHEKIIDDHLEKYILDGTCTAEELPGLKKYWAAIKQDKTLLDSVNRLMVKGLPGAQENLTTKEFLRRLEEFKSLTKEKLWENAEDFFVEKRTVKLAEENGLTLSIHTDDPSFSVFGVPRIISSAEDYIKLMKFGVRVNSCTGSLMTNPENRNPVKMIFDMAEAGAKQGWTADETFPHIHMRPIITNGKDFFEGHHSECRQELRFIALAYVAVGVKGAVIRPDHALAPDHHIGGRDRHGYDFIGRGYGAEVLMTLFEDARCEKEAFVKDYVLNRIAKEGFSILHLENTRAGKAIIKKIEARAEEKFKEKILREYEKNTPQVTLSMVSRGAPGSESVGPIRGYSDTAISAITGRPFRLIFGKRSGGGVYAKQGILMPRNPAIPRDPGYGTHHQSPEPQIAV